MRKNSNIIRAFDALTIVKGINSLGGPDKQVYYIESDVYAPDRRITPLLLQPYVNVSDPNGIITAGDKVSELVDGAWYVDAIDPKNSVTKSSAGSTLDDPFTIGDNHRLMVRLNTDKSVMLFFEGDYYDSRKGSKIHISLSYMLSTTHNSQNKPAPKVLLSKGASYTYNPLDDLTELIIESQLADDGKLLRGAVEWCEVEGTKITAISDAMPYYISGQHSDKLKINPSLMGDVVIRARNPSEEFYNKVYGINPEWDNRMKEVFENRNLILNSEQPRTMSGGWIRYAINPEIDLTDKTIIFNFESNDEFVGSIVLTDWDWSSTQSVGRGGTEIKVIENKKYLAFQGKDGQVISNIKLIVGNKVTPYTPAPEDLNFRNLAFGKWMYSMAKIESYGNNGVEASASKFSSFPRVYKKANNYNIVKGRRYSITFNGKSLIEKTLTVFISNLNGVDSIFSWRVNYKKVFNTFSTTFVAPISTTIGSVIFFYVNDDKADFENTIWVENLMLIEGDGDNIPYNIPPEDYAPDGIIKGTYQSDMKFTPLYPNIEANVVYLTTPVIKKGVERIKAQAMLSTNKKIITNPEKHFDLKWILKPATAGGSETMVGTGEFLDIPVTNLPEGRVIGLDLDYNFKKQ